MTMTTTKAVMLAVLAILAALTVGVCAIADGPDGAMSDYRFSHTLPEAMNAFGTIQGDAGQFEPSSPKEDSRQPGIFAR
jgi:hypothetical protein